MVERGAVVVIGVGGERVGEAAVGARGRWIPRGGRGRCGSGRERHLSAEGRALVDGEMCW